MASSVDNLVDFDDLDSKNAIRYFEVFRDYMKHEDGLINYRTTWLNTIQSFLIAAFALTYQKTTELLVTSAQKGGTDFVIAAYKWLLAVFSVAGIGTSIIAWSAILAAVHAIETVRDKWLSTPYAKKFGDTLPGIVGGGHHSAHKHGTRFALWLPRFFLFFWLAAGLLMLTGIILPPLDTPRTHG